MKLSALAGLLALATTSPVHAITYQVTDLGSLQPDMQAVANAINRRGEVVGGASKSRSKFHAVLWRDGVVKDLGTLGGDNSVALAVNSRGHVVGRADLVSGRRAFLYRGHGLKDLGTLGGLNSTAWGINRYAHVVGEAQLADGTTQAFIYQDGTMTSLGTLGGSYSAAGSINDSGQVTGIAYKADGSYRAFLYSDGVMTDLGALDGTQSLGNAINSAGEVTGYYELSASEIRAFLYTGGAMQPLGQLPNKPRCNGYALNDRTEVVGFCYGTRSTRSVAFVYRKGAMFDLNKKLDPVSGAGWVLREARGINNAGQIVGWGTRDSKVARAFLLTPIKP